MPDRSIELLNKNLPIFGKTKRPYLDLVGDASRALRGWVLGATDLSSDDIDLSVKNKLKVKVDAGAAITVDFSGIVPDPAHATRADIVATINGALGPTVASIASSKFLKLTSPTTGTGSLIEITPPTVPAQDTLNFLFGMVERTGYDYKFPDPNNRRVGDFDIGAIANSVEYTRQFQRMLILFLSLAEARGSWLDCWGYTVYGVPRPAGMTDDKYRVFLLNRLTVMVATPPALRYALDRAFGTDRYGDNVQIIEGMDDGMFSDVSFTDYYVDQPPFSLANPLYPYWTKAALAGQEGGMPFFFRVIMENVLPSDYLTIISTIEGLRASGTTYVVEVLP